MVTVPERSTRAKQQSQAQTARLVVVSNRLPVTSDQDTQPHAGGLVSALMPALEERGGLWFGWSGHATERPGEHQLREQHLEGVELVMFDLDEEDIRGYYEGYSNSTLWPRLHGLESRSRLSAGDYQHYRAVNRQFARHLRPRLRQGDIVWVHDYHLIPLGEELRRLGWDGPLGYFHHIPVPDAATWERIPQARDLTLALTAYDHVGVQTETDVSHLRTILGGHRVPRIEAHAARIDTARYRAIAEEAPLPLDEAEIDGRALLMGIDRLDYTKGIPLRLEAWEMVLDRRPDLREAALFVQWAAPSREGVDEYVAERATVEQIGARIQARFGGERSPLRLEILERPPAECAAAMRRADVAVVTSFADGMNLVSKEFAAVHDEDRPGVLVLSRGCGAADGLPQSVLVQGGSVTSIAEGIERALDMTMEERRHRSRMLRRAVDTESQADWAGVVARRIESAYRGDIQDAAADETAPPAVLDHIAPRRVRLATPTRLSARIERQLERIEDARVVERLWDRDPTLWPGDAAAIRNRLGWLDLDDWLGQHLAELRAFSLEMREAGFSDAVVMGMGGSSAAARIFAHRSVTEGGPLRVHVLDSTAPEAIRAIEETVDLQRTLFVASSKSGDTIETRAFLDYFWARVPAGEQFVAITDAGSPLDEVASNRGFRRSFLNRSDIGGRFSALSSFGLVPAALAGVDLDLLAAHARAMARACQESRVRQNPAAQLAAVLAEIGANDRGTVSIQVDPRFHGLGDWLAQLIAESTGKRGRGLLPVLDPQPGEPHLYGRDDAVVAVGPSHLGPAMRALEYADRPVVHSPLPDWPAVAGEFVLWETAVAIACSLLRVNAFDEPDVAAAKGATACALRATHTRPPWTEDLEEALGGLAADQRGTRFVALHAYLPRTEDTERRLRAVQHHLRDRYGLVTALEFGPALLHATGQYHKGGPGGGLVVQVLPANEEEVPIPGRDYGFARLLSAQASGDATAMLALGRRVSATALPDLEAAVAAGTAAGQTPGTDARWPSLVGS